MILNDRVYGKIKIENKLLTDLIKSGPMQRLKGIKQAGPTFLLEPKRVITRFEHSIGVWFILKRYGASLEEQVAGLLHDTPHTAFSHVADVIFPNESHNFHEKFEEKIILTSDIPSILLKHGMDIKKILNKSNFHLLEADLPDLSADRIDYFLRDTRIDPIFPKSLVNLFLDDLNVKRNIFYFEHKEIAFLYSLLFMDAGKMLWLDSNSHGSHKILGDCLKYALKIKLIKMEDLFGTDDGLFAILKKSNDKKIKKYLSDLSPAKKFEYASKSKAKIWSPNKPRAVDPWVDVNGKLVRTSNLYRHLSKIITDFKEDYKFIGVV